MLEARHRDEYPPDPTLAQELAGVGEDDRIEMTNFHERHTGLPGVIFVSSRVPAHGPRIKYYLKSGKDSASCSISIAVRPSILASSLPARELNRFTPPVLAWVGLNHEALLRFWNEGEDSTPEDHTAFLASLRKV